MMKRHHVRSLVLYCLSSLTFVSAACAVVATGKPPTDELYLSVTVVTGEHSRDSNSTITSLTVSGDTLSYEQTYHGAHSGGRTPVKKEYKLTSEDRSELTKVLKQKNLLFTRTLSALPQEETVRRYFSLAIHSRLSGKEHSITIDGPRNATKLKTDPVYRNAVYLIEQIYKIINRTDPDLSMPEIIENP